MDDFDQLFATSIAKLNYEGEDAETIRCKAKEMLRLMNMKLPHGSLRKAEAIRPLLALDLSLRVLAYAFNKSILSASISPKDYNEAITICKNVLKLSWDKSVTIESLSIQFECENVSSSASQIISKCQELSEVRCSDCIFTAFDTPLFHAVAFFLAARHLKINIRQKSILDATEVDERIFRDLCDHLKNDIKIFSLIGESTSSGSKKTVSRGSMIASSVPTDTTSKRQASIPKNVPPQKQPHNNKSETENIAKFLDDLKTINKCEGESDLGVTSTRDSPVHPTTHNGHRRSLLERQETLHEELMLQKKRNREIYELFALEVAKKYKLVPRASC